MRRLLASWLLVFATAWPAASPAATMSDLWWNPNESGWGMNVIEQQGTLFVTLFVYGADGQPTWYVGSDISQFATSSGRSFTGALYRVTGPWFGGTFNPSAVGVRQVGTLTIAANSPVSGTVTYSVDGVTVTKSIERQTWKHINLSGTYYGASDVLSLSTCALPSSALQPFYSAQTITALISTTNARKGSITMSISDGTSTMSFSGSYTQYGALYEVSGTMNFLGTNFDADIRDFTADDDGIRGNILMQGVNGCIINLRFSAVKPG